MSTETILLESRLAVMSAMDNEACVFIVYGIAVILGILWFGHLLRRWSWMPRKQHGRQFVERF